MATLKTELYFLSSTAGRIKNEIGLVDGGNDGGLIANSRAYLKYHITLSTLSPSKKGTQIRNRYNQVPHLTKDTKWESYKNTIKHHKREPRGKPFPTR